VDTHLCICYKDTQKSKNKLRKLFSFSECNVQRVTYNQYSIHINIGQHFM